MVKSRDAFRTISEVADWLDTPAHVLRFWESKFTQIKPVKRAGGRRYYRPEDMALLGGIKTLLHDQGMTIKGAQKLLRDMGIKHVSGLGPQPLDIDDEVEEGVLTTPGPTLTLVPQSAPEPTRNAPVAMPPARPARPVDDNWSAASSDKPDLVEPDSAGPADPIPKPRPEPAAAPRAPVLRNPEPREPESRTPEPVMTGGTLTQLLRADRRHLAARAARLAPLARRLTALRDQMARNPG